ncbi:SpoIIE family protein phosphatase [Rhodohalobacter sulfatireducens]|uniref:SpoIIE family protein phosphatase n=1 Tax=Rhodohalobacter sulfatireducens TaxID=2911366 RepID=A0ABS9KFK6_9BACT|nr:SpoIIE family protein phosphatase [Rhodohalobacter sulfatireducens]MCG2589633.1 SpoIIE family protein phosphatase [Rhodohalobacter sulfatireducens]
MNNSGHKILVVDDEPDLQMLMMQKFRHKVRSKEYEFLFAENGRDALDKISENSTISLILSDINMPKMDGLTLLDELQDLQRNDLKAIMVSAYGDMENIRTAMNRGAYDFVTKPIDFNDLETTIEKTLKEIARIQNTMEMEEQLSSLNYDLDMAARIQQKILKQDFPVYEEDERFDVYAHMIAAKHVGGDFYDFFKVDDDKFVFFIGDVSGKGMPAAIYMAVCRTMLKSIGSEVLNPAECITKVNNMLIPESDITTFVTVFYGIIDLKKGELSYCNGGHNLPYLLSKDGNVKELSDVGGLLLGKFEGAEYDMSTVKLEPGDSIVTFTDGVTEAENDSGGFFDEERVIEYLEKSADKKLNPLVKGLFLEVMKFAGSAPQSDDITVLTTKYEGN